LTGRYGPDVFWEYISDFLERQQDSAFFLYYPMFLTHFYFSPTPESPEWETGDRHLTAEHHLRPDPLNQRFFSDMVRYMDKNVGRIVEKLETLGIRENTLIIFLGDNGTERSIISKASGREIRGEKGTLSGPGTRVPMIANWPWGGKEGVVSHVPVVPSDVLATISDITGAKPRVPTGDGILDGISFFPLITGKPGEVREWALVEYVLENRGRMYMGKEGRYVMNGRWKLYGDGVSPRGQRYYRSGELYDLQADPLEQSPIPVGEDNAESARARRLAQEYLSFHPVPARLRGEPASKK
jgi:arylsulfatase A-like enzyme